MSKRHRHGHPCPTATKTAWPNEDEANKALAAIRYEHDREPIGDRIPVRAYRCECRRWHLTSSAIPYAERRTITEPVVVS